jgi:hypothetical protein
MSIAYLLSALLLTLSFFCDSLDAKSFVHKMAQALQNRQVDLAPGVLNAIEKTMPNLEKAPDGSTWNVIVQVNNSDQQNNVGCNPQQFEDYKKMLESGKATIQNGITKIFNYISNNKTVALLGSIAGCYIALQTSLAYLNYQLKKKTCWSLWRGKKAKNFSATPEEKKDVFGRRLLTDIQQAYTDSNDPTDFVSPLTLFMKDTEQERKRLKRYQQLTKVIDILHINRFFFYDQRLVKNIPERLQDLASYRKTFLSWLGTVKVNQTKGMPNQDFQCRGFRSMDSESEKRNLCYLRQPNA